MTARPDRTFFAPAVEWLSAKALPLWANAGFEFETNLFHERLTYSAAPIPLPARRLMVQARQIATYSRSAHAGLYKPEFDIVACLDTMTRCYCSSDGAPGWVFSIGPDLRAANSTRDLYAHAFVLYALAWSYRLLGDPSLLRIAKELLAVLDAYFLRDDGSLAEEVPVKDRNRRQNPHMHLFEAYLAMAEASGDEFYLQRARVLLQFARTRLIDRRSGLLLEEFDAHWQPLNSLGRNQVEPGHLFEWAWLLREFERLDRQETSVEIEKFTSFAIDHGRDLATGLLYDAISETGTLLEYNFRCWPHTEALRLSLTEAGRDPDQWMPFAREMLDRLQRYYIPDSLNGGWIDRVNAKASPLVDYMPASTLYHVAGAFLS